MLGCCLLGSGLDLKSHVYRLLKRFSGVLFNGIDRLDINLSDLEAVSLDMEREEIASFILFVDSSLDNLSGVLVEVVERHGAHSTSDS